MWGNGLKLFPVEKFVIHGCDPWELRELLCVVLSKSVPIHMRKGILESQMGNHLHH
jgi:hypothetical protein